MAVQRDLGEGLPDQLLVPRRGYEERRRAAAPLQVRLHVGDEARALRRVFDAPEQLFAAADLGPTRNQCGRDARPRSVIRVLVGRHLDSFGAGLFNDADGLVALPPDLRAEGLDVRDVYGNPRLAP